MQNKQIIIGLTGTIASGKSAAAKIFESFNIPVVDADELASRVTEPGSYGLEMIAKTFGDEYINEDGSYNRALMRELITNDKEAHERLNTLLHPIIKEERERAFTHYKDSPVIVYDCPLLFEAGEDAFVDEILLITLDEKTRIERLMKRDQISKEEAEGIIAIQLDEDEKIRRADSIIVNDGSFSDLETIIGNYLEKYKRP